MDIEIKTITTKEELKDFRGRQMETRREQFEIETKQPFYQIIDGEQVITLEAHQYMLKHPIELPEGTDLRKIAELPENERTGDLTHSLAGEDLSYLHLREADLQGFYLRGARMIGCDLSKSRLSRANLEDTDIRGADLSHSDVRGATINEGTKWDNQTNFAFITTLSNLRGADPDILRAQILRLNKISADQAIFGLSEQDLSPAPAVPRGGASENLYKGGNTPVL